MVKAAPAQTLGRTQLMKLIYFLETLKGVNLGYHFRLFNYGPFDSDVLSDLGNAIGENVVKEVTKISARGYGYEITPAARAQQLAEELETNEPDLAAQIDDVVRKFGAFGAAEMELRSTIVFVDREFHETEPQANSSSLTKRVRQIKPRFTEETILDRVNQMNDSGWLLSLHR